MVDEGITRPLVSVIVPVYNTEQYFDRCISSILSQSYKNIEIIVVNDGSKGDICKRIKKYLYDFRVHFINNNLNSGLLRARIIGAEIATGEYIAFVDSDDYLSFDFYRNLIDKAEETNADIVIGKTVWDKAGEKFIYNFHESCFEFDLLEGDEAKEQFFSQETACYSWHTIWNKLYRKTFWDKCIPEFETVKEHIVMTEDLYFSSILFCHAPRVSRVGNDAYFYCINENASTNSESITYEKYRKNVSDITYVFDKVDKFLRSTNESEALLKHFKNARAHYARMWWNFAINTYAGEELEAAKCLIDNLCCDRRADVNDYFFETIKTPWNGGLEYIKEQIAYCNEKYISFDIFDTLVERPFYEPTDLYRLLDKSFSTLEKNNIMFSKIRIDGEQLAREYYGHFLNFEDITIDEIYSFIEKHYRISHSSIMKMLDLEKNLELRFSKPRESGRELFKLAVEYGKQVILISDMYLDRETIKKILEKCKIYGYKEMFLSCEERKLKYDGSLFRKALVKIQGSPEGIIHIGDSWSADIKGAANVNIKSVFFPKAKDIFENSIKNCITNSCAEKGQCVCGDAMNYQDIKDNLGFRSMQALVCQKYFDNPYRSFHEESDFNIDPFFIGYYLLGMHMLAVAKWILNYAKRENVKRIVFLARDGYLPYSVLENISKYTDLKTEFIYMQASRKALMPYILKKEINFYQPPVEYRGHTPRTINKVFSFACNDIDNTNWEAILEKNDMRADVPFKSIENFHKYIKLFLENLYSKKSHDKAKKLIEKYYIQLNESDVIFDMGYSGRIQVAINEAVGFSMNSLFLHEDFQTSVHSRVYSDFDIMSFYNYHPSITGLIREHIFSDTHGSCTSFNEMDGQVEPIYEKDNHDYPDKFVVERLHRGALEFVDDFMRTYKDYTDILDFSEQEVSLPFEGFLRHPKKADMHIFSESYFEDLVYGACEKINIENFVNDYIEEIDVNKNFIVEAMPQQQDFTEMPLIDIINKSPKWKRAFIWLMYDRDRFIKKFFQNCKDFFGNNS